MPGKLPFPSPRCSASVGRRDYALLAVMVTTGLRTISVVRADVGDIRTAGNDAALYGQEKL